MMGHHPLKSQKLMRNLKVSYPSIPPSLPYPQNTNIVRGCFCITHNHVFAGWFEIDEQHNHNVYVSGLPLDITKEEFAELMGKCGIIKENEEGRPSFFSESDMTSGRGGR